MEQITINDYYTSEQPHNPIREFALEDLYKKPTQREKEVYSSAGGIITEYPPCISTMAYQFDGPVDFNRSCICHVPGMDSVNTLLKNITLRVKFSDPKAKITSISKLINNVRFELNSIPIQRYTGMYLEIMEYLYGTVSISDHNKDSTEHEYWINLPWIPNFGEHGKSQDCSKFPIGYIQGAQRLSIRVDFADYFEADISPNLFAEIYYEVENPHPLAVPRAIKPVMNWKQIQFCGTEIIANPCNKLRLYFTGPIESLFWRLYLLDKNHEVHHLTKYTPFQCIKSAKLYRGSIEIVPMLPGTYFNEVVPKRITGKDCDDEDIYCWTFASDSESIGKGIPCGSMDCGNNENLIMQLVLHLNEELFDDIKGYNLAVDVYAHTLNQIIFDKGYGVVKYL